MNIKKDKKLYLICAIITILIIISIITFNSYYPVYKLNSKINECKISLDCKNIKEKLENSKETFTLSTLAINLDKSKDNYIYFGIKNIFAKNLTLYPRIFCTDSIQKISIEESKIITLKKIYLEYNNTYVYPIYIQSLKKEKKYYCTIKIFDNKELSSTRFEKIFTIT